MSCSEAVQDGSPIEFPAHRLASRKAPDSFALLAYDAGQNLSLPLHVASNVLPVPMRIHRVSRKARVENAQLYDLALFDISIGHQHAFGAAGEVCAKDPTLQCLFVTDDLGSPPAAAARSLGITRIVTPNQPISWWSAALQSLAVLTNAKRSLLVAESLVPPIPTAQAAAPSRMIPLQEAERQFRVAYLSKLIKEARSNKIAASRAGLPYTTLCSMIKKLGLDWECPD